MPPAASVADSAQASCRLATARARTAPAAPAALAGAAGPAQGQCRPLVPWRGCRIGGPQNPGRASGAGGGCAVRGANFALARACAHAPAEQPARAGGAADSALSDPPRAHLPGLLGSTRAAPLAGPAENHKPARKLRALSSSRQGPGRRLKKGVKIRPPPLTTFPRRGSRGSRLPDPAAPARLQPSSGTAWCQSAAQSGGSGLLRPCWPQAPPGHSQPAGKGEPGETGMGESHIVFE